MKEVTIHITDPCEYDIRFSEYQYTAIIAARIQGVLLIVSSQDLTGVMQVCFYNNWHAPSLAQLTIPIPPSHVCLDLRNGLIRTLNPAQAPEPIIKGGVTVSP